MQWADEVDDGEEQAFPPRFLTDGWLRRVEEQLQHLQVRDPTVASGVYEVVIERFPDLSFIFSVEHGRILGITRGHDPAARSATKIDPARLWELLIDSVRPIVGHQAADHDAVWVLRRLAPPHRALQRLTQWNPEVGDEPPGRDRPARGVAVVLGLGRLRA